MKHILSAALVAAVGLTFTSCEDFIDNNRFPETSIVNSPLYWSNADNCELQVKGLRQYFYGYGNGNTLGNFYFNTLSDDQCGNQFTDWKNTNVPASSTNYTSPYTVIRWCNLMIQGIESGSLTEREKAHYIAHARMMRGYEYYLLVRRYGDVCYTDQVLDPESPELYSARVDRKTVMDKVYDDVLYAAENLNTQSGKQVFSKDMAKAMLSDICLFEGTFWKYCTKADNYYEPDANRSALFLNRCVEASQSLLAAYPIGSDYAALYNSTWKGSDGTTALNANPEVIYATEYEDATFQHSTIAYTCSSTAISGLSKDAFDAYLFKDGKPLALTSLNTTDVGVKVDHVDGADNNGPGLSIQNLLDVRDGRLAMTTDPYIYYKNMTWSRWGSNQMTSASGYGVRKYDNGKLPVNSRVTTAKNYTCSPLYWGAVVALNYAEAKAELGTLTDADMNQTLNKLYARAGLPDQTVASLSNMNDPANNMGVSSLLWEVRRCRRCELIMDNDYRYWDLIRWHKLDLLDSQKHPNILLGANATNAPVAPETAVGAYVNGSFGKVRIFEARQYQYPIPSDQLTLNKNLEQNANWK
ncbi:MAG: RagB/SusD family nutrient uptake outer membrane protein [Muribaculaceae bacterium]|nr:RagB/SusD family nutrient uptake outer membrane protein [Muribaculaceae bacterium]